MKKVKWNVKKCFLNLGIIALFVFLFYEVMCYMNDVIEYCVQYCD